MSSCGNLVDWHKLGVTWTGLGTTLSHVPLERAFDDSAKKSEMKERFIYTVKL